MTVRNVAKGEEVADTLTGHVEVRQLDVSDLESIRSFARDWTGPLNVLANNAGIMDVPLVRTRQGLDVQTATNSLGPFLLTRLLLPHVTDRVVWVTSQLHRLGHVQTADLASEAHPYKPMDAYLRLETAAGAVLTGAAATTQLWRIAGALRPRAPRDSYHDALRAFLVQRHQPVPFLLNDPEHGALPILFAATQDLAGNSYVGPDGLGSVKGHPTVRKPGRGGLDATAARALWDAVSSRVEVPALRRRRVLHPVEANLSRRGSVQLHAKAGASSSS